MIAWTLRQRFLFLLGNLIRADLALVFRLKSNIVHNLQHEDAVCVTSSKPDRSCEIRNTVVCKIHDALNRRDIAPDDSKTP